MIDQRFPVVFLSLAKPLITELSQRTDRSRHPQHPSLTKRSFSQGHDKCVTFFQGRMLCSSFAERNFHNYVKHEYRITVTRKIHQIRDWNCFFKKKQSIILIVPWSTFDHFNARSLDSRRFFLIFLRNFLSLYRAIFLRRYCLCIKDDTRPMIDPLCNYIFAEIYLYRTFP